MYYENRFNGLIACFQYKSLNVLEQTEVLQARLGDLIILLGFWMPTDQKKHRWIWKNKRRTLIHLTSKNHSKPPDLSLKQVTRNCKIWWTLVKKISLLRPDRLFSQENNIFASDSWRSALWKHKWRLPRKTNNSLHKRGHVSLLCKYP